MKGISRGSSYCDGCDRIFHLYDLLWPDKEKKQCLGGTIVN